MQGHHWEDWELHLFAWGWSAKFPKGIWTTSVYNEFFVCVFSVFFLIVLLHYISKRWCICCTVLDLLPFDSSNKTWPYCWWQCMACLTVFFHVTFYLTYHCLFILVRIILELAWYNISLHGKLKFTSFLIMKIVSIKHRYKVASSYRVINWVKHKS